MRIVLLSFGFIEYSIQLANALSKLVNVILMVPRNKVKPYAEMIEKDVNLKSFNQPRLRYITNLLMFYRILQEINRLKPNVIHLQEGHPWFNFALPHLNKKYSLVTTIHDVKWHYKDKPSQRIPLFIHDIAKRNSSQLIVHGSNLKNTLVEDYSIPMSSINVIPHGEFSFYKKFAEDKFGEEGHLILFFGRIWEYKGLRYLIEAEPLITEEVPSARIVIAGKGEDFQKYREMMVHKEKFIIYNHYIPNETVAELFQKASIVVLPYITASQSGVIPLAYAFKKPVVATDVGSIPEVVDNGRTGYIVPPRDSRELAEAIIKLLKDRDMREKMGENAYSKTKRELSWEDIARKTKEVYDKALESRSQTKKVNCKANRSYKADRKKKEVALRKFPYPYKAAMTICSDIDGTATKEEFLEIQKFLNSKEMDNMGKGLGLEIGNSFFMYSDNSFSYFGDSNNGPSSGAETIRKFIKAGLIDCLHSYGDKADFCRKDAVRALEELSKYGCKVDIWVDHGRAVSNFGKDVTFGLGDVVSSDTYHADLTIAYGVKFVWLGKVTCIIGQSTPITITTFTSIYDPDHPVHSLINMGKDFSKNILAVFGNKKYAMHKKNELVRITKLDDGQRVYEFMRFNNYWSGLRRTATCRRLAYVISKRTLKRLKKVGGYMIVYTHLGKNSDCSQVIAEETQITLRNLASEFERGNIYVTTTSRLLNYYLNHKYLNWLYETRKDEIIITIFSVEDPVFGSFVPTTKDLHGVTFYVPDKHKARIYINDREIVNIQRNSPDYRQRESVTIL